MPHPARRVRLHRLLFLPRAVAPLLLLVPLGALKWRYDWCTEHPLVSKMDQQFRADLSPANSVSILGSNPVWGDVTHLSDEKAIFITDRKLISQLTSTFRLSDESISQNAPQRNDDITLLIYRPTHDIVVSFDYCRNLDGTGSYITRTTNTTETQQEPVKMPLRFGPRFEALIGQLAQRAKAPGRHLGIELKSYDDLP